MTRSQRLLAAVALTGIALMLLGRSFVPCGQAIEDYRQTNDYQAGGDLIAELRRIRGRCARDARDPTAFGFSDGVVWTQTLARGGGMTAAFRAENGTLLYVSFRGGSDIVDPLSCLFSPPCASHFYGDLPATQPPSLESACLGVERLQAIVDNLD